MNFACNFKFDEELLEISLLEKVPRVRIQIYDLYVNWNILAPVLLNANY